MKSVTRKGTFIVASALMASLMLSCQQEKAFEPAGAKQADDFVSMEAAKSLAKVIEYPVPAGAKGAALRAKGIKSTFKEIEKVLEVPDAKGKASFYIVNYKDGGFIILSADKRAKPIRAFSPDNTFPLEAKEYPAGLVGWLSETNGLISGIRSLNAKETENVAQSWNVCDMQKVVQPSLAGECDTNGCENTYRTVGPLMATAWGQGGVYNDLVENINCEAGTSPTGCVATAMAQIMNYHKFPNTYNWANMPNTSGTLETARLMRDIGTAVDMDYSCSGSGADMKDAKSAFSDDFSYQNAVFSNYNYATVKQQLDWGMPVMLSGYATKEKKCFLFFCAPNYTDGHAWVCDGYRSTYDCQSGTSYLYLSMNWGWDNRLNGFFAYNRWNPGTTDYQYEKEMLYNIRP